MCTRIVFGVTRRTAATSATVITRAGQASWGGSLSGFVMQALLVFRPPAGASGERARWPAPSGAGNRSSGATRPRRRRRFVLLCGPRLAPSGPLDAVVVLLCGG